MNDCCVCFNLQLDVFEAAELYQKEGIPLIILAGKKYGSGNSRDWAAKGPYLLVLILRFYLLKLQSFKYLAAASYQSLFYSFGFLCLFLSYNICRFLK